MRQFPPISEPNKLAKHQQYMIINGQKYGCFWKGFAYWVPENDVKFSFTKQKNMTVVCRPHQSYGWKIKSVKL